MNAYEQAIVNFVVLLLNRLNRRERCSSATNIAIGILQANQQIS